MRIARIGGLTSAVNMIVSIHDHDGNIPFHGVHNRLPDTFTDTHRDVIECLWIRYATKKQTTSHHEIPERNGPFLGDDRAIGGKEPIRMRSPKFHAADQFPHRIGNLLAFRGGGRIVVVGSR